jgi:hypothetical protein
MLLIVAVVINIVTISLASHLHVTWHENQITLFHQPSKLLPTALAADYFVIMTSISTAKTPMFEEITLVCSDQKSTIQASILTFPPAAGSCLDKVQAFTYFEEILQQHRLQLTSTGIQQAYAKHVPVSSPAAASEEANLIATAIYDAFYSVLNLECMGFFTAAGQVKPVAVAEDASKRDPGICFVKFEATITPADISSLLSIFPTPLHQMPRRPSHTRRRC